MLSEIRLLPFRIPSLGEKLSDLVIGWVVGDHLIPTYWLNSSAKAGEQSASDLVSVSPTAMTNHTVIVAQSGSGKSFFLGRLIEEIGLRTMARCVVLDPNADFRQLSEVLPSKSWSNAKYNSNNPAWALPHERNNDGFKEEWDVVLSPENAVVWLDADRPESRHRALRLNLVTMSFTSLSYSVDPGIRNECFKLHDIIRLVGNEMIKKHDKSPFDAQHRDIVEQTKHLLGMVTTGTQAPQLKSDDEFAQEIKGQCESLSSRTYDEYFDVIHRYRTILNTTIDLPDYPDYQIQIVDLPSFINEEARSIVIETVLNAEKRRAQSTWAAAMSGNGADDRVPTFIVVDEAHNLMPHNVDTDDRRRIRDAFRWVAAEGRKFGVFLIACTQRPDKIDHMIVSECRNRALMRIGSQSVLDVSVDLLGLEDIPSRKTSRCLDFGPGRILLAGKWAPDESGTFAYVAMRRTREGGADLPKSWAAKREIADLLKAILGNAGRATEDTLKTQLLSSDETKWAAPFVLWALQTGPFVWSEDDDTWGVVP